MLYFLFRNAIILCIPIIFIALGVVTIFSDSPKSIALIISLILSGILMITGIGMDYYLKFRSDGSSRMLKSELDVLFCPTFTSVVLLHTSAISLFLMLLIRIDATDNFGGSPQNLNFGEKFSSGVISEEDNIAFTLTVTTVGHTAQGLLCALMSYPAVTGWLARGGKLSYHRHILSLLLLFQLFCSSMSIYPSYSMLKRLHKDYEYFSRTSHMNNSTEWVLGYMLGVSIGYYLSVVIKIRIMEKAANAELNSVRDQFIAPVVDEYTMEIGEIKYGYGKSSDYKETMKNSFIYRATDTISKVLSLLLSLTSLLTGIFIGWTWNLENDDTTTPEYKVVAGLSFLWAFFLCIAVFLYRYSVKS